MKIESAGASKISKKKVISLQRTVDKEIEGIETWDLEILKARGHIDL